MDLVRFELRLPKKLRDLIRMETVKQQEKGFKVAGRVSGQYLLPIAALEHFLTLPDSEKEKYYKQAAESLESLGKSDHIATVKNI